MIYIQIASLIVGLIVACLQCGKEAMPVVTQYVEAHKEPQYSLYRGTDSLHQYYSDKNGVYWCRVDRQGVVEYSKNPQSPSQPTPPNVQICSVPVSVR